VRLCNKHSREEVSGSERDEPRRRGTLPAVPVPSLALSLSGLQSPRFLRRLAVRPCLSESRRFTVSSIVSRENDVYWL
jgi:hypothetical protein